MPLPPSTDAAAAIGQLSNADWLRLEKLARFQVYRYRALNPKEVLNEAIARVLTGERTWHADDKLLNFLEGVIRSVADELRGKEKARLNIPDPEATAEAQEHQPVAETHDPVEDAVAEREIIQELWTLFAEDEGAQAIMLGIEEGMTAKEIQKEFNMTSLEYDAARKRFERKIDDRFPEGRPR
jgi:DNA-directed RNA polymerase specialized sigma24 family protein